MSTEDILNTWKNESNAANEIIIDVIESYMEFVDIFEATLKYPERIAKIMPLAKDLITHTREKWQPILEFAKKHQGE